LKEELKRHSLTQHECQQTSRPACADVSPPLTRELIILDEIRWFGSQPLQTSSSCNWLKTNSLPNGSVGVFLESQKRQNRVLKAGDIRIANMRQFGFRAAKQGFQTLSVSSF
jgi:hypothetical protein